MDRSPPQPSDPTVHRELRRFRGWMVKHNRVISIVLGLVIGVLFLVKGVAQIA